MADSSTDVADALRRWAKGMNTTEAATELLIRACDGTFASIDWPWIKPTNHGYWIDFPAIAEHLDPLSAGEQRLLRIAASIGSDDAPPVPLGEVLTGLDRRTLHLVLAAIAHAGGSHQHCDIVIEDDGRVLMTREPSLYAWDDQSHVTP